MSKELDTCRLCSEDYCARCFNLELCGLCSFPSCEECYDKANECEQCGDKICPICKHKNCKKGEILN